MMATVDVVSYLPTGGPAGPVA